MRFLFSFPLPLLLIFISPVLFDTQGAPSKLQEEPSPSRDYAEQSTTDIRYANSSYANRRHARQIGTDLSYDGVKPMALASEADSTETAENYEQLSFDELEKRKEQAEKDHTELKDKLNQARDALKTKEDEAKEPMDDYDKKKQAYEDLDAKAKGMNLKLHKAEAEYEIAEQQATDATEIYDELKGIEDDLAIAKEDQTYVENAQTRKTIVDNELGALQTECSKVDGKSKGTLERAVNKKTTAKNDAQTEVDKKQKKLDDCTSSCDGIADALKPLQTALTTATNEYDEAVKLLELFNECPGKLRILSDEINKLDGLLLDHAASVEKAKQLVKELEEKTKLPKYDNAEENQKKASGIFDTKKAAKETAEGARDHSPEEEEKAKDAARDAKSDWEDMESGHAKFLEEIGSLKTALQELEEKFAKDEARVGALQKVYQKKLSGKDPGKSSATIIAVCAVLALLLVVGVGVALFFALKRRKAAKGKEKKSSDPPPTNPDTQKPAEASGKPQPTGTGSTERAPAGRSFPAFTRDDVMADTAAFDKLPLKYQELLKTLKQPKKIQFENWNPTTAMERQNKLFVGENMKKGEIIYELYGTMVFLSNREGECWVVFANGEKSPAPAVEIMEIFNIKNPGRPWLKEGISWWWDRSNFYGLASRLIVLKLLEESRETIEERAVNLKQRPVNTKRAPAGRNADDRDNGLDETVCETAHWEAVDGPEARPAQPDETEIEERSEAGGNGEAVRGATFLDDQKNKLDNAEKTIMETPEEYKAYIDKMFDASKTGEFPKHDLKVVRGVLHKGAKAFAKDALYTEVEGPTYIIGDTHGNLDNIKHIFDATGGIGSPNFLSKKYAFLGDYVDRGKFSIESMLALTATKIAYPEHIFLLRGNHESPAVNRAYGFYDAVKRQLTDETYGFFAYMFAYLPLCLKSTAGKTVLCMHGGIPDIDKLDKLDQINTLVPRPLLEATDDPLATSCTWDDPGYCMTTNRADGPRGPKTSDFSETAAEDWCKKYLLNGIVRAHQVVVNGFEQFGRCVISIFSATSYELEKDIINSGSFLLNDANGITVHMLSPGELPDELIRVFYFLNLFSTGFHAIGMPSMADNNETERRLPKKPKSN